MGYYINPIGMSKVDWLRTKGVPVSGTPPLPSEIPDGKKLICLVDNGMFTAAGICFNNREYQAFADPKDYRPKMWFIVGSSDLEDPSAGTDPGWNRTLR